MAETRKGNAPGMRQNTLKPVESRPQVSRALASAEQKHLGLNGPELFNLFRQFDGQLRIKVV